MKRKFIKELVEAHLLQEKSIAKQKHPFKAILMTGPAGAGKTFVSKNLLGIPAYIRKFNLNPDDIIEYLFPKFYISLKFAHGKNDPLAHAQKEMRKIAKVGTMSRAAGFINRAKPLFIDTTGEDVQKMGAVLDQLVELGYDVGIINVFVPQETSQRRDQERERTVGEPVIDIWDDYNKNVVLGKGYDQYAKGKPHITVLNPEPFYNVYNLGKKDAVVDGKLIAKGRSKVLDVVGDIPVSIEQMDRAIADLKKSTQDFLEPYSVPNPIGATLYEGMLALMQHTDGRLGQEITDFYKVAFLNPDLVKRSPEVVEALQTLQAITGQEITDQETLVKSFDKFEQMVRRGARGKEGDISAPLASRVKDQMKGFYPTGDDDDEERIGMVAEAIAKRLAEKLKK